MNSSSATTVATSPSFRKDDVIPDHYFSNLAIFFIVLITVGLIAARVFKKYVNLTPRKDKSRSPITKQTTQLSPATKLHVVEYEKTKIIVVESTNNVSIKILSEPTALDLSDKQSFAMQNYLESGESGSGSK